MISESEFKSEDPGFDPLAGQDGGGGSFSVPPIKLLCTLDSFVPDPPFVCTARTKLHAHVKDPLSTCRKRAGLTAGGMVKPTYCVH